MNHLNKLNVLIVGCGDVGNALARQLKSGGARVFGLRRNLSQLTADSEGIYADVTRAETLTVLQELKFDYVVVATSAGEFTEERYRSVYVEGLRNLLEVLKEKPRRIIFLSSTSVYHQKQGEWVDEESATLPDTFAGQAQLAAEKILSEYEGCSTVLRLAGIYGPGRDRLIRQVLAGQGCAETPPLYSNRIHRDDVAGIIAYLLEQDVEGVSLSNCYLCADNYPAPLWQVKQWIAGQLGLSERHLQASLENKRRASKRCRNTRLLALGYQLKYSDFREGYQALLVNFNQS